MEGVPSEAGVTKPTLGALEHVGNRPIAHHVVDALRSAGVDEIVVVSSDALADAVGDCMRGAPGAADRDLRHTVLSEPIDLASVLGHVAPIVGGAPCVVHSASGLLGEPLVGYVEMVQSGAPDALLFVHQRAASNRRLNTATREMLHLAELYPDRAALNMAGICMFGPGALQLAAEAHWDFTREVDLTQVADRISRAGGRFEVLAVDTWREYAGNPLDLLELNRIVLDRLQTYSADPLNHGNQIEGRVWIHEDASVISSVIVGPTMIGAGARIADSYIGPYTSVGPGARIEGAEVERSIISAGASILHVGSRIIASVVGRDARVFRDFSLPRALRLQVGDEAEVALW